MRISSIATALFRLEWAVFAKRVIPPWVEGCQEAEAEIKKHFLNAKEVISQRDRLTELFPHKKEQHRVQCEEIIWELAGKIAEHCEPGQA